MPRRGENIRKRKDGRWEGRYIKEYTLEGKAKYGSIYDNNYSGVKEKLLLVKRNQKNELFTNKHESIQFREVLFLWLDSNKIKLRPQTYAKYMQLIENHLAETLGNYRITRINSIIINRYIEEKHKNGRLDGTGGLSGSSIKTIIYIINCAIEFAVRQGFCLPLNGQINKPVQTNIEIQVLTREEQKILENAMFSEIDGTKLGILISLHTGLRLGEVCGLRWEDIDFTEHSIEVKRTAQRIKNCKSNADVPKTTLALGMPKTLASNRTIPVPSYLIPAILVHKNSAKSEFVVSDNKSHFLDPRTFQNRFHRYLVKCGIRNINFHALRHTFATRCMEVGVDIKSLSEILGHASVNITLNTYVHSSLEQKRCQIELLDSIRGQ